MQLQQYDLTFSRLTVNDIELVRNWRNSELINQWMIYRDTITAGQQLEWFNKLDNDTNYYFVVMHKHTSIGLMNIKDIDLQKKSGEPGGFVVEQQYLGTIIPALCLLMLFDFAFFTLGLDELRGKVLQANTSSMKCNLELGGVVSTTENGVCRILHTRDAYIKASNKYREAARALYPETQSHLCIT
jgi:UDP-4-amino-4,6-dideoxy-N-acetyl-beta-L-altrosamine N-acetyltransferase